MLKWAYNRDATVGPTWQLFPLQTNVWINSNICARVCASQYAISNNHRALILEDKRSEGNSVDFSFFFWRGEGWKGGQREAT